MAKKTKPKKVNKPRAEKYEDKLKVNGSFEDLAKTLITPTKSNKDK